MVLDKLFGLGSELSGCTLGLHLCQLQVLVECFELELRLHRLVKHLYVSISPITFVDVSASP